MKFTSSGLGANRSKALVLSKDRTFSSRRSMAFLISSTGTLILDNKIPDVRRISTAYVPTLFALVRSTNCTTFFSPELFALLFLSFCEKWVSNIFLSNFIPVDYPTFKILKPSALIFFQKVSLILLFGIFSQLNLEAYLVHKVPLPF